VVALDIQNADATYHRLLSGPMVEIYVGAARCHWPLHRNLQCHHSRFFDEDFTTNGEQKKIKDGQVELLDEDPDAFESLVKYLYQGKIEDVSTMPMEKKWDYAESCQKLYLLCDWIDLSS
jgi:hypothetical protein